MLMESFPPQRTFESRSQPHVHPNPSQTQESLMFQGFHEGFPVNNHMCTPRKLLWVKTASGHAGAAERAGKDGRQGTARPTCSNDFFNLHKGYIDLLGKLSDCLVGVLVSKGVDVDLHPWRPLLQEICEQQQKGEKPRAVVPWPRTGDPHVLMPSIRPLRWLLSLCSPAPPP